MNRKTASGVLDAYIDSFEGKSKAKNYTRRVGDLLSPRPSLEFMATMNDGSAQEMNGGNQELLKWINTSYKDNLESTCQPIYNQDEKRFSNTNEPSFESFVGDTKNQNTEFTDGADDFSSLPSPDGSDNEPDSDQETITTDVLLSSYNADQKQQKWVKNAESASGYPSWVENIDQSVNDLQETADPRRFSSVSSLLKSSPPEVYYNESRIHNSTGLTMDDTASIDTDVILQTSVYGEVPINMGGHLHSPLFKDKRVERMVNDSRTKRKKNKENMLGRSVHGLSSTMQTREKFQSPQSRDVLYAKQILNKHRSGDVSSKSERTRHVIGKSVEQISQDSRKQIRGSLGHSSGNRQPVSISHRNGNHPHSKSKNSKDHYQRRSDKLLASNGSNSGVASLTSRVPKMKLEDGEYEDKEMPRRTNNSSDSSRQFVRHTRENSMVKKDVTGARQVRSPLRNPETTPQTNRDVYHLLIPKTTDYIEQSSPRTSGYYSDMYLASPSTLPRSSSQGQLSSPTVQRTLPAYKTQANLRRDSNLSQSSGNTDALMRQSPSGIKMHQRSQTWASNSVHQKIPQAMSTPKNPFHKDDMGEIFPRQATDLHASSSMRLSSDAHADASRSGISSRFPSGVSKRTAPSSRPHSAAAARSFIQARSQFSRSPLLSGDYDLAEAQHANELQTSRTLSDNASGQMQRAKGLPNSDLMKNRRSYGSKPREMQPVLTNWRSHAETNGFSQAAVKRNVVVEENVKAQDVGSYHEDVRVYDSDRDGLENLRLEESDVSETELNSHNRTWPSLERYKRRSKLIHSEVKATRPTYSGWAAEKRSIPLRPTDSPPSNSQYMPYSTRQIPSGSSRDLHQKNYRDKGPIIKPSGQWKAEDSSAMDDIMIAHDLDNESTTADTELLLVQPPMPVVDASPSLSTLSDESTIIDSQSESEAPLYADLPLRSSSRVSFAPNISYKSKNGLSPLSTFASTNPRNSSSHAARESMFNVLEEANPTQKYSSTLREEPKAMKSELLDSFIEDCLRSTNGMSRKESLSDSPHQSSTRSAKLSGRDHPGSVETLKHMLLNLNGAAGGDVDEERQRKIAPESTKMAANFDESTDETSSLPGEQSLSRAYHHLERLKSLISSRTEL